MLRKTSTYLVSVRTAKPSLTLDKMLQRCPVEVNGSGTNSGVAQVRFRCKSDDNTALNIALEITGGAPFVLTTGYGVNEREVQQ